MFRCCPILPTMTPMQLPSWKACDGNINNKDICQLVKSWPNFHFVILGTLSGVRFHHLIHRQAFWFIECPPAQIRSGFYAWKGWPFQPLCGFQSVGNQAPTSAQTTQGLNELPFTLTTVPFVKLLNLFPQWCNCKGRNKSVASGLPEPRILFPWHFDIVAL